MADTPKRRLRPAQTLRDKAEATKEEKPPKKRRLGRALSALARPFNKAGAFLARYKFFRALAKVAKFIGRILLPRYLRNSWREIKLVTWPNWRESRRLTVAVIGFAVVFGAFVASLDYGLGRLFKVILLHQ